jgi:hypothetical protein
MFKNNPPFKTPSLPPNYIFVCSKSIGLTYPNEYKKIYRKKTTEKRLRNGRFIPPFFGRFLAIFGNISFFLLSLYDIAGQAWLYLRAS